MRERELALAEIIGAFIGDGFMNKYSRSPIINFSGDKELDKAYFEDTLMPLMNKVFPRAKPCLSTHSSCNGRKLRYHSHEIAYLFMDYGFFYGPKSHLARIPTQFYEDEKLLMRVIRGIFDTDGCVYVDERPSYKRPYPRITFTTVSWQLFARLVQILSGRFSLYLNEIEHRGSYVLEVYGYKQISLWIKTIGFSNPRHLSKLEKLRLCSSAGRACLKQVP